MPVPVQEIASCRAAHLRLFATVDNMPDAALAAASRLPGWSVAHVLTHLARNADSMVRRLEGAREGRLVEQYEGGRAGRARDIDVGAARDPHAVKRDVIRASEAAELAFANCPAEVWDEPILLGTGEERPATYLPASRWREVEIHHVDLGLSYGPHNWSDDFVGRFLPRVLESLSSRTDPASLLAWGLGRADAPPLSPWA